MQKYVLITGGQMGNKGAQAMTFITVDEVSKRYPECKIVLFSNADYVSLVGERSNYRFEILPYPSVRTHLSLYKSILKRKIKVTNYISLIKRYKVLFRNAAVIIDISGYALGSNWGNGKVLSYMRRIKLAQRRHIPIYLMPQSFGPFDFKGRKASLTNRILSQVLPYASIIMAREFEGKELLETKYHLKNVVKTPDLVLQNKAVNLQSIYINTPDIYSVDIAKDSIAIIPNMKNYVYGRGDQINALYVKIIQKLLDCGKHVYLIYHSMEDLKICRKIKSDFFQDSVMVIVLEHEFSYIEFEATVKKFRYVIASRYHSIVLAYRCAIPAIVLGWATKYQELLQEFSQQQFGFDVRREMNDMSVIHAIDYMNSAYTIESEKIAEKMADIQKGNVYDFIHI